MWSLHEQQLQQSLSASALAGLELRLPKLRCSTTVCASVCCLTDVCVYGLRGRWWKRFSSEKITQPSGCITRMPKCWINDGLRVRGTPGPHACSHLHSHCSPCSAIPPPPAGSHHRQQEKRPAQTEKDKMTMILPLSKQRKYLHQGQCWIKKKGF